MASSKVEICNSALSKLGAEAIVNLTDDNKNARLCNEQYDKLRRQVLREHPWNFATKRTSLAISATPPVWEYDNAFVLPLDCLRVIYTDYEIPNRTVGEIPWEIHIDQNNVKVLVSNESSTNIKYIFDQQDTSQFSADFDEVLAWRIAADLAYPVTQSTTLSQTVFQAYNAALRDARSYNGQEGSIPVIESDELLDARA